MNDSDTKTTDKPGQLVPVVSEQVVKYKETGQIKTVLRGEGGKFVKKKRTAPKSQDVVRYMRELLQKAEAGPEGKLIKGDKSRFRRMFDNMFEIAQMSPYQPVFDKKGDPVWLEKPICDEEGNVIKTGKQMIAADAKVMIASVTAFKELMLRSYGMPSRSDEEMDAMKEQGVKIVVLTPPEMINKEVVEEKPRETLKPSFAEVVEIIENK